MTDAAAAVMNQISEVVAAYGQSDEFSFVLRRECSLFDRREDKLVSTFVSVFTAHYQFAWSKHFPQTPLDGIILPTFDGRAVLYPTEMDIRNYLSWRQADCHINNLYNTTFWNLVQQGGLTEQKAEERLIGSVSSDKHDILFLDFQINYNNEPEIFKKGTLLVREPIVTSKNSSGEERSKRQQERDDKKRRKAKIEKLHIDIIGDKFWSDGPGLWIL
ncbi:Thg1p [Lipomyces japonicus]|uniref:Thg1p n=1 Tax=Lipomyces japonicus TaxID=56871 RepID=UPI0034CE4D42